MKQGRLYPSSFQELLRVSNTPVLANFRAEWCAPCKQVAPEIARIAREYKNRLTVVRIDIDRHPELAQEFAVNSIPSVLLFDKTTITMRLVGAHNYQTLRREIDRHCPRRNGS